MSDRERWIMYPLLFLSIGLSMRNSLLLDEAQQPQKQVEFNVVHCKELKVLGADDKARLTLGTTPLGEGSLELRTGDGRLAAQLSTNPTGALLSLFNRSGDVALHLGYDSQQVLMLITDRIAPLVQQIFSYQIQPAREPEQAPQKAAPPETPAAPASETKPADDAKNSPENSSSPAEKKADQ